MDSGGHGLGRCRSAFRAPGLPEVPGEVEQILFSLSDPIPYDVLLPAPDFTTVKSAFQPPLQRPVESGPGVGSHKVLHPLLSYLGDRTQSTPDRASRFFRSMLEICGSAEGSPSWPMDLNRSLFGSCVNGD